MIRGFRYDPGPPARVDLSDNTNLWGAAPAATAALAAAVAGGDLARYPSAYGDVAKAAAARYLGHGLTARHITLGCGSDHLLDVVMRVLAPLGGRLTFHAPTFVLVRTHAGLSHLEVMEQAFAADGKVDPDALLRADADLIYLCNPNNPTGAGITRDAMVAVVAGARGVVVVDEAYAEYAGTSAIDLLARHPHLVVLRTMSKAFGLAGLRVGYAASAPDIAERLEAARGPFRVSASALVAAAAAIDQDRDWMVACAAAAVEVRARFTREVTEIGGWTAWPSQANFVLVSADDGDSSRLDAVITQLAAEGIAVRRFPALPGIGDAIRVTMAPWDTLQAVVSALRR